MPPALGRVSKRDTAVSVNGGSPESFTQSWLWNDLGNLASVTYPKCTHAGCTAATHRTVSSTYTNGFLTGVTGYASSISYHPNGQVNQVVRANNTTDTWTKDPQNQLRPNKIDAKVTSTGTIVWNSGVYGYDAAGALTSWNGAVYQYDEAGTMWSMKSGAEDWIYVYTADDERIWSYKPAANLSRWTLRGLDNMCKATPSFPRLGDTQIPASLPGVSRCWEAGGASISPWGSSGR